MGKRKPITSKARTKKKQISRRTPKRVTAPKTSSQVLLQAQVWKNAQKAWVTSGELSQTAVQYLRNTQESVALKTQEVLTESTIRWQEFQKNTQRWVKKTTRRAKKAAAQRVTAWQEQKEHFSEIIQNQVTTIKTNWQKRQQKQKAVSRKKPASVKTQTQPILYSFRQNLQESIELEKAYWWNLGVRIFSFLSWPQRTITVKRPNQPIKKHGVIFQSSRWSIFVLTLKTWATPTNVRQSQKKIAHRWSTIKASVARFLFKPSKRISTSQPKPKKLIKTTAPVGSKQWFKEYSQHLVKKYWLTVTVSVIITAAIIGGAYGVYVFIFKDLPAVTELTERAQPTTTRIKDRHGEVLYRIYEDENRTLIRLQQIPLHVVQATIAIEDQSFYSHQGFSIKGITRAFLANLEGKSVQGGSTITQQLVKNRLLTSERTLQRKVRELLLSVMVDASYSKDQILEMYFNQVAYGGSTYGIEEAAQMYFGKPAKDLTLAEGAMLAGLPAAPSVYSPFGPHPELAYARQEEVLRRMVVEQFITQEQADAAKQEILQFRPNRIDIKAPHFVMYVKQILAEKFGEQAVEQGGLEVTTSLDLPFHNTVQKLVTDEMANLARLRISNGAAVVTKPETGEVLSMVGSKDYFDFEHDGQVNVTIRPRQPGSSIKPLTYATAMERGRTPYSVIADTPISYHTPGSKPYAPKNYDGKFHGNVTLKQALASSYNIPAVKLLAEVGINTVIDKGTAMGISTWGDRSRFGLSLTLGGGEVLMTDLAELYGTFANYGNTVDLNPILEVKDSQGKVLYRNTCALDNVGCPRRKNLDERVAFQITQMLSDNVARTPAFGPRSVLHIPGQQVAVKTGTTNNLRDNWTIGYTSDILVAVWVGNNDNTPMSYVASGVTGASPIWNSIIRLTLDDAAPHVFATPEGLVTVKICAQTGTLTCSGCPTTVDASFVPGTEPQTACNPAYFRPKPKPTDPNAANGDDPNRDKILEGFTIGN